MAEVNWQDDESVCRDAYASAYPGRRVTHLTADWEFIRHNDPTVVAFEKANRPAEVGRPKFTLLAVMPGGEKLWGYLVSSADAYMDKLEAAKEASEARAVSAEAERDALRASNERLTDLVRYMRIEMHQAKVISDEEYAALVADSDGGKRVARLEGYDLMQAERDALRKELERLKTLCGQQRVLLLRWQELGSDLREITEVE